ncbi:SGNH/GDSL hydrolase family protein [Paenibacillus hodogayensis]|uniref:SGNH/GDSL hydrolase family protein n=1 Tax=Paenibacillus hodogayensis TaxID=279208 RepID=A0ABV5W7Z9_9BACL
MAEQTTQSNRVDAQKLDPNMKLDQPGRLGLEWLSPKEAPFRLSGFAWFGQDGLYRRLPAKPSHPLPPAVDALANSTAGGQIMFRTDSPKLAIRVELGGKASMYHMPATGQCGFDLYLGEAGDQQYCGTIRYDHTLETYESVLYEYEAADRHITLNFPLYQGVKNVWIGIEPGYEVQPPLPYKSGKKVVVYGTSITQGGCATRPGMAYTNILSRRIPLEFINLGFSGNGRGESEVAHVVSEIADPALIVLDYEANAVDVEMMERTLPEFIRICREAHPDTPILVVSKIQYARERFDPQLLQRRLDMKRVEMEAVEACRSKGDTNIHFFDGTVLLGTDSYNECTVDGVHPTDLGFLRMADTLEPVFKALLKNELE